MRVLDPRLLERTRGVRALVTLDVVVGVAAALLLLLQATLFAEIVARAFDGAGLRRLTPQLALLALTFAARGAAAVAFEVAGRRAATTVLSDLRLALLQSRLRGRPAAHDGVETAEVAAAAVQGVEGLEAYFGRYLPQLVLACTVPVVVLVFVATVDPLSALIMLLTLPLVPVFMWLIGRYSEERARERWRTLGLLSAHFLDVVRGLPTLRAYDRGRAQVKTIGEVGERYRSATMGTLRVAFLSGSVLELAATLGVALVAVSIGVRLVGGSLALQSGLTALVLAPELYLPFRRLGAEFHASADGLVVAERILELLDVAGPPAAIDAAGVAPSPATGAIRFESVSFAYPARPGVVLEKLDFELLPGETVALVGPSGAGKSTVAALLLRLAEPTDGRITCGGVDLARSDPGAWRRQVAWVPQHPTIFRGTAAENIRLGSPDATHAEVREAARLAGADAFLRALPDGYETLLGDGGRSLSAGEKRRVALARAFLRAAPFVVLDEPTADLDPDSAALVADAVDELRAGRTVLVIAHRAELVERADRVILLGGSRANALEAA